MKIDMNNIYIPTGNEQISIPTLYTDGSIESINFVSMKHRGLIEITGEPKGDPLIKPILKVNGEEFLGSWQWERETYWVPSFLAKNEQVMWKGEICAPIGERGFYYRMEVTNTSEEAKSIEIGLGGKWYRTLHTINESKEVRAYPSVFESGWNDLIVFELLGETPLFAFAPMVDQSLDKINWEQKDKGVSYEFLKEVKLQPNESFSLCFYWGIGLEEVGAATSAKEMLRKGFDVAKNKTMKWLQERIQSTGNSKLDGVMNLNLFFNFFFATGQSLDTEEDVLVTSRSPRYYVSAAYWDRDSLLWSFPSILVTDAERARRMLDYVFTIQRKNIGVHSRYIDGIVLEPGFELDELCAPVIALDLYLKTTNDWEYLSVPYVQESLKHILRELKNHRHDEKELYDTFLQPTDDPIVYAYLTYNNVLVWKVYCILSDFANRQYKIKEAKDYENLAIKVKEDIYSNMVMEHEGKKVFAWSVDLKGKYNIYDEPPGSLQLLPYYGFCSGEDIIYRNTVELIRSPKSPNAFNGCEFDELGCDHANHPWILSVANSFLSNRKEQAKDIILRAPMDGGIACESIDENTGISTTGDHFATCAGFLAYGIYYAYGKKERDLC